MNGDWIDFKCEACRKARENGKGDSFCQKHKEDFVFKLFNPMQEAIDEIKNILDKKIEQLDHRWNYNKWERSKVISENNYIKKNRGGKVGSPAGR